MNHLYYGDNLRVLRDSIDRETVDLIYLDSPINSDAGSVSYRAISYSTASRFSMKVSTKKTETAPAGLTAKLA